MYSEDETKSVNSLDIDIAPPRMHEVDAFGDPLDELPFAMDAQTDDGDEIEMYRQKFSAPAPLSMFASRRQDLTESICSLESDLRASLVDRDRFFNATKVQDESMQQ